jgi:hypothetical protein
MQPQQHAITPLPALLVIRDLSLKRCRVMDDTTLGKLSGVNDALIEHLKWLLEKKDLDAFSRVIPNR